MHGHHDSHHSHEDAHHLDFDAPEAAAFIALEGEVLAELTAKAISVVAELCRREGVDVGRVLDLGCGPGVGTCALAQRFDRAMVVAVDGSAAMVEEVTARAARLGLAPRVEARPVDLPTGLGSLGRADVVWVSMALHHVGDEGGALAGIRGVLEPGGLLALVEAAGPSRFVTPDVDLGRPGIWDRLDAAWWAWFAGMRAGLPGATASAPYPTMLEEAGFEVLADEVLTLALDPPLDDAARRLAYENLARAGAQLSGHADAADLEAIAVLLDEDAATGILRRPDAVVRASRHLYVARSARGRPADQEAPPRA